MNKRILSLLIALVLMFTFAGTAAAQTAPGTSGYVLELTCTDEAEIGSVVEGITISRQPLTAALIYPLLREATGPDAQLLDAKTEEAVADDAAVATGMVVRWSDTSQDGAQREAQMLVRGDVLGTGTLSLSQLTASAALLRGTSDLTGVYAAAACITGSLQGGVQLVDIAFEAEMLQYAPAISAEEAKQIVDEAVAVQTDGDVYSADQYDVIELHKGDVIYGMLPGQSSFYTNAQTVAASSGSYVTMYHLLQMKPHEEFGYRTQLGLYEVQEDTWVATGYCLANSEIEGVYVGAGGGVQFVIPDYETVLAPLDAYDLAE